MKKKLMKGNHALAEGAVRAGCRFFGGYPITPQSEILEYLSIRMPEVDGQFIQTESEISGISMVYGAASAGFRALTSSSGPGFSLKQEGISYIVSAEVPAVIVDVQRLGNGLGDIMPAQEDYFQAVKGGGHGEYNTIVYAPGSVQENADLTYMAFDSAEKYRNPVIILSDGALGQMMEPVALPEMKEHDPDRFDWALKGKGNGKHTIVTSTLYYDYAPGEYEKHMTKKFDAITKNEQMWESVQVEDAEVVLISYGISSRICKKAVKTARKNGVKLGLLRPITLWPFPKKAFNEIPKNVKGLMSVEMNTRGQLTEDIYIAARGKLPVYLHGSGRFIPDEDDILKKVNDIINGSAKEVF